MRIRMNRKQGIRRAKRLFNHIVISSRNELGRLVGFEDSGEDYYWIIKYPHKDKFIYESCVGWMQSMKKMGKRYYSNLEAQFEYHECFKEKELILEIYEFDSYEDMIAWCHGNKDVIRKTIKS